jgi:hypothetical protein
MYRLLILTIVVLCLTGIVPAQAGGVDVTPEIAYYNPQSEQANLGNGSATAQHASSVGFGGRLTFWVNETFALEATGMFTSTDMEAQLFGETGAIGASVFFGTGRAVVGFGQKTRFLLNAGLGFQSSSYDFIEGGTWMIGVAGAGFVLPINNAAGLRLGVDDYIYNAQWDLGDGILTDAILQHDVTFTVGLSIFTGQYQSGR